MLLTIALVLIIIYLAIKIVPIFSKWLGAANTFFVFARGVKEYYKETVLPQYTCYEDFKNKSPLVQTMSEDLLEFVKELFEERDGVPIENKILANYSSYEDFKANFHQFDQLTDNAKDKMMKIFEERDERALEKKILANYSSYEEFKTNFLQFDQLTDSEQVKMLKMFVDQ